MTGQSTQFQLFRGVFGRYPKPRECDLASRGTYAIAAVMKDFKVDLGRAQDITLGRLTSTERRIVVYLLSDALGNSKPGITSLRKAARFLTAWGQARRAPQPLPSGKDLAKQIDWSSL